MDVSSIAIWVLGRNLTQSQEILVISPTNTKAQIQLQVSEKSRTQSGLFRISTYVLVLNVMGFHSAPTLIGSKSSPIKNMVVDHLLEGPIIN